MLDQLSISCKSFSHLTTFEVYEILHLRHIVFSIEQKCLYIDTDGFDQQAYHLMLIERGTLVAYARLFDVNMPYPGFLSIGRVVTHPDYRNKQYGKLLMQTAVLKIRELFGVLPIKIGAQAYLTSFYSSFGFMDIGQYYLEDGIPHLKMVKD
ncbi:MAG: GNAT family N-acetyltransferase [Saprospiraceae bacterium]